MRTLRYPLAWFTGGMLLIALLLFLTLMPSSSEPSFSGADKFAHGTYFAILMIWFCGVFEGRHAAFVGLALLLLGLLIEVLQRQLGYRSAELWDAVANLAGIVLGGLASAAGLNRWTRIAESLLGRRST